MKMWQDVFLGKKHIRNKNKFTGRLIPVPREISASCGLAWKCGEQNEEETASYMKEQDLEYEKIYRILA